MSNEPWSSFEEATVPDERLRSAIRSPESCWKNSRYTVWLYELDTVWGPVTHLSIKRNDREPIHDWRDLQRIKNELTHPQREAIEIYPAEARLTDTANQYHLWVLEYGRLLPIGFHDGRIVSGKAGLTAKQRPFEVEPEDQIEVPETLEDIEKMAKRVGEERKKRYREFLAGLPTGTALEDP